MPHAVQNIMAPLIGFAQLGADQLSAVESEFLQMLFDKGKVIIAQIPFEHRKKLGPSFRGKLTRVRIGNLSEFPEEYQKNSHGFDGVAQYRIRVAGQYGGKIAPLLFVYRFARHRIELSDDSGLGKAVLQNGLAIRNRIEIAFYPRQDHLLCDDVDYVIVACHCLEQRLERQIRLQRLAVPRQTFLGVEILALLIA